MWRSCPAIAAALPIRPPLARYSSVSTVKIRPRLALEARDELVHLLVGRPALEPALDRERQHGDRSRRRLGVDRAHALPGLRRRPLRALVGPGQPPGEVDGEHALVAAELLVGGQEVRRRGLRGRGRPVGLGQPPVELGRVEVDVVAEALVAEAHVQRDDAPVGEALRCLGEVGGRVEHDRRVLGGQFHGWRLYSAGRQATRRRGGSRPRSRRAADPSSGRRPPRPRSGRPRSRAFAEAVSAITAVLGHASTIAAVAWTPSSPGIR